MEEEIRKAIKILMNNWAPVMDGISTEMMIAGEEMVTEWMCGLCNQVWKSGDVPEDWKNGSIICIPKKGNLNECDN